MDGITDRYSVKAGKLVVLASTAVIPYHVGMHPDSSARRQGVTWFVSRHPGAIEWAKRQSLVIDRWVEHLDPAQVNAGDTVMGTLPVNLAAEVCRRSGRYLHLSLKIPPAWRGRELSTEELQQLAAHIEPYHIEQMTHDFPEELA